MWPGVGLVVRIPCGDRVLVNGAGRLSISTILRARSSVWSFGSAASYSLGSLVMGMISILRRPDDMQRGSDSPLGPANRAL